MTDRPPTNATIHRSDMPRGWVDAMPRPLQPYLRLMRLDRPIGTWLLLLPGWWSLALANFGVPELKSVVLFLIGAVAMRGAGCTYNDIVDRDIDARVERTKSRPLPSGAVSLRAAWLFLATQALVGLCVLLLAPAWTERAHYDNRGAALIRSQGGYDATDGRDLDRLVAIVQKRHDGRVYAGLRALRRGLADGIRGALAHARPAPHQLARTDPAGGDRVRPAIPARRVQSRRAAR